MSIFIIAEIGINHNGDMSICKKLIDAAVESGCNAVKLQKRDINKVFTQEFLGSSRESPWGATQREQKSGLEFSKEQYEEITLLMSGIKDFDGSDIIGKIDSGVINEANYKGSLAKLKRMST